MKVLHVCEYLRGGIATYLKEILTYQKENKNISKVYIALSAYNSELDKMDGVGVIHYPYKRSIRSFLPAIIQIQKIIKEVEPDIVHVHSSFAGFFVRVPLFFMKKNYKVIYCSHGWSFLMEVGHLRRRIYSFIERILSFKTDLIINISNYEFQESIHYKQPLNKSIVIYNGLSNVIGSSTDIDLEVDPNKINLMFVGRFDRQKGIDILMKFLDDNHFGNINLYLVGGEVLETNNYDFPKNVINLGWIDNIMVNAYYQIIDAVIMPSRWEGFGLVAIEAMRNRKAVLASNRGALPEIVKDGVNGFLFDLQDMNILKKILANLNKTELKNMGERGYEIYNMKFTSSEMNKKIIEHYIQLNDHKRQNNKNQD